MVFNEAAYCGSFLGTIPKVEALKSPKGRTPGRSVQRYARALAHAHKIGPRHRADSPMQTLDECRAAFRSTLKAGSSTGSHRSGAQPEDSSADNVLSEDIAFVIGQCDTLHRELARNPLSVLPQLFDAKFTSVPRVVDLAREIVLVARGRISGRFLVRFIATYQKVLPLELRELWSLSAMLKLALFETLERAASATSDHAEGTLEVSNRKPQLTLIRNCVKSLHRLNRLSWLKFVESVSVVERILRGTEYAAADRDAPAATKLDIGGHEANSYEYLDDATRDQYRHAVEQIARRSKRTEWEVAQSAVDLAEQARVDYGPEGRLAHVGFYLIDAGLPKLEATLGTKNRLQDRLTRWLRRHAVAIYLMLIAVTSGLVAAAALGIGWPNRVTLALAFPFLLLAASQAGVTLVNWLASLTLQPRQLPRMSFSNSIPSHARTLVAVPCMLSGPGEIRRLVKALEVRFLANPESNLHFALLTDWIDAQAPMMPDDRPLLELVEREIEALNDRYGSGEGGKFLVFHRPRSWNPSEGVWMGRERKRGKLAALNQFLRGKATDGFSRVVGDTQALHKVKYVIVLDADTQLPRDAARRLVATMVHPLNRPICDENENRLVAGYAILQPRIATSLPSSLSSWYARLFGGQAGIDPYTGTVSDVYQDLCGEGSFIGKGIYDVDAVELLLDRRFPDNLILSHDLLEGCHARSGLVGDVELYESFPSHYGADASRRRRWMRGDWQIAMWAMPRVPGPDGTYLQNPLSLLSRWKVLDNLRRSLLPAALVGLMGAAWMLPPGPAALLTTLAVSILFLPIVLQGLGTFRVAIKCWSSWSYLRHVARTWGRLGLRAISSLSLLPHEAYYGLDAIFRTMVRLLVTKRHLLQWQTSAEADRLASTRFAEVWRAMWIVPLLALALGIYLSLFATAALVVASLPLLAWFLSPAVAWWLSRPLERKAVPLDHADREMLEEIARKTWRYFETFVGPEDNWLPPDNYQEHPGPVLARRTSPTDVGLALLSTLAAADFGFLSTTNLCCRIRQTLFTLNRLERHRGHFLNWYSTRTLEALPPKYVSTVDSGNLIGHLHTLREGLLELPNRPLLPTAAWRGLQITLRLLQRALRESSATVDECWNAQREKQLAELDELGRLLDQPRGPVTLLNQLALNEIRAVTVLMEHPNPEISYWSAALMRQARDWNAELEWLKPLMELESALTEPKAEFHSTSPLVQRSGANAPTPHDLTLLTVKEQCDQCQQLLQPALHENDKDPVALLRLHEQLAGVAHEADARIACAQALAQECLELATADFRFLLDRTRPLLSVGFNVATQKRDLGCYDLLASEARLTVLMAIASGQLQPKHWFALGRSLTRIGGEPVLLSWTGSMFEYLMPLLVAPAWNDTLLESSCATAVAGQIAHGARLSLPWGVSEAGYNALNDADAYRYRGFGCPNLGLQANLQKDAVVAPYATLLALMVEPKAACANLRALAALGVTGQYGYYESIDFTAVRCHNGSPFGIVRSYMAHHQGMSLLAIGNVLFDRIFQRRLQSSSQFHATQHLLHENTPVMHDDVHVPRPLKNATDNAQRFRRADDLAGTDPT